ncbi:hypothetical protein ACH5RR_017826 [Cinchona calisaya]|uniref:Uncharacterized protein n=1 Tax=Cinchona calisaya TaxID=153742 RepID=A0ABD2ZNF5_9GENT
MGCCLSTKSSPQNLPHNSKKPATPPPSHPLLEEEETVKEVLSETPSLPKKPTIIRARHENPDQKPKTHFDGGLRKPIMVFNPPEEVSEEASEISESVSTATFCTEKNEDGDYEGSDHRQRSFRHRSLSGDSRRERVVGKSPSKRSEPSPGRARSGSCGDARGLGANNGQRRDCGESSGRRSGSPATRADGGGAKTGLVRSGSARKSGRSPGRVKSEVGDKIWKLEDPNSNFSTSSRENKWPPTSNESLENPLVSLECFIFL